MGSALSHCQELITDDRFSVLGPGQRKSNSGMISERIELRKEDKCGLQQ